MKTIFTLPTLLLLTAGFLATAAVASGLSSQSVIMRADTDTMRNQQQAAAQGQAIVNNLNTAILTAPDAVTVAQSAVAGTIVENLHTRLLNQQDPVAAQQREVANAIMHNLTAAILTTTDVVAFQQQTTANAIVRNLSASISAGATSESSHIAHRIVRDLNTSILTSTRLLDPAPVQDELSATHTPVM